MEDKKERLKSVVRKARPFTELWSNEDFQYWKKEAVDKRLDTLKDNVLSCNVTSPEGRDQAIHGIIRYQELKGICEDIFKLWQSLEDKARKELA